MTLSFLSLPLLFALSCVLTGLVRFYALDRGVLDVPNGRSSHSVPMPKGGGLAIALTFFGAVGVMFWAYPAHRDLWLALLGGAAVATIGWLDDHQHKSSEVRLAVQVGAALWALGWLGGLPAVGVGTAAVPLGPSGWPLALLGIVWATNLYNFMDGIDGLAGGQAVVAAAAAGAFLFALGDPPLALACWALAAAVGGFLCWNWPRARVFMGDVGSGTLGFTFAVLAVYTENQGTLPLLVWLLLLAVFVVDATATLVSRLARGYRYNHSHRAHAYQRAVQCGHSHLAVTSAVLYLGAGLAGLAALALRHREYAPGLTLTAFSLLFALWWRYHAPLQLRRPAADR